MAYCRSLRFTWQTLHPCSCATDVVSGWHLASSRNNSQHLALQVRDPKQLRIPPLLHSALSQLRLHGECCHFVALQRHTPGPET